jgi:WD40 repeat protein
VVNDNLIASGGYEVIKFWDARTVCRFRVGEAHFNCVLCLQFECVHIMKGHGGYIYAICAVDSKRIATASNDKTICIWNVHKGVRVLNLRFCWSVLIGWWIHSNTVAWRS